MSFANGLANYSTWGLPAGGSGSRCVLSPQQLVALGAALLPPGLSPPHLRGDGLLVLSPCLLLFHPHEFSRV
jgi:hypothetical protein